MQVSTCWDEELPLPDTLSILETLSLRHAHLGGHVGSRLATLIKSRDYAAICAFELPLHSWDWNVQELFHCRQSLAFFQKLEDLEIGVDKEAVALKKFIESEQSCHLTNNLFRSFESGCLSFQPDVIHVLHVARRKIERVLGVAPDLGELGLRLGPGATTSIKKRDACPQNKFAARATCSDNLYHSLYLQPLLRELPAWLDCHTSSYSIDDDGYLVAKVSLDLTPGRLEFVPKNARTYRAIVVEPMLNGLLQAGIGDYMSKRLKRAGLDISDQSKNKNLARQASLTGGLATLDLSSASDSISYQLVKYLLPEKWFTLLNSARSCSVSYMGHEIHLNKFSSMGNGFTFPLETLIFWAISRAAAPSGEVSVYGDDIICPTEFSSVVCRMLSVCGFTVNTEKSFTDGPFRESCGGDYYLGFSIRPFYQKHLISGLTLFVLHNFYQRLMDTEGAMLVRSFIPRPLRLFGPDGYGDGHLISDDYPRIFKSKLLKKGYCGHFFETYTLKGRRSISRYPGDYVSPLYSVYRKSREPLSAHLNADLYFESARVEMSKCQRPIWVLPGHEGYKKMEIYTFLG